MSNPPLQDVAHWHPIEGTPEKKRVAIGCGIGATIETYDFIGFGTAAALYFGNVFFPESDPLSGTLLSFATLGIGFAVRPMGGIVGGYLGDRIGRKPVLVGSLLLMGVATVLIGLLPTYQMVGIWAPILLVAVRVVQGLAFGAEWGGAILMTFEHAPWRKRGLYTGITQAGFPVGLLLANLAFLASVPLGPTVGVAGAVPAQRGADRRRHPDPAQDRRVAGVRGAQGGRRGLEEPAAGGAARRLAQRAAGVLPAHRRDRRLRGVGHVHAVVPQPEQDRRPSRSP